MRFVSQNRFGLLALSAMSLFAALGVLASRAGDASTDTAATTNPPLNVREANIDAGGNIKVHEQGTVTVTGTVEVGNTPKVLDVNVTNEALDVQSTGVGTVKFFDREFFPFDQDETLYVDIHKYSKVRLQTNVNGSGTVEYFFGTDGGVDGHFSVDAGHDHTVYLGDLPGTTLEIDLRDPDGEQVFVRLFGTN
jgi:hypothetical protein